MIKAVVTAVAEIVRWFFSEGRREDRIREEKRGIRSAVYEGDEDAVNRIVSGRE